MRGALIFIPVLAILLCGISSAMAGQTLSAHIEYGWYNHVYNDPSLKEEQNTTFATPMTNYGCEYLNLTDTEASFGAGFVCTQINGRTIDNAGTPESQTETSVLTPYVFTGIDRGLIAIETGLGCYLTIESMDSSSRLSTQGTVSGNDEGNNLQRRKSYVLPNLSLRIFPEKGFHLTFQYGRGVFNAVDSYCQFLISVPLGIHIIEAKAGLPADWCKGWSPQTNQRFYLGYALRLEYVEIGIHAGYLAFNHRGGGDGNMPIFDQGNFSIASSLVFRLP